VLAGEVGLNWSALKVDKMPCLPRGPRSVKGGYQHQGAKRPHDEIFEGRNALFTALAEKNPRLVLTLGAPAANIVVRGRLSHPPRINLAEDRYGFFHAPYRWVTWKDVERKRGGRPVTVREYEDTVDPSRMWPVLCTWSPGEVGAQPRLRDYYCEDLERALRALQNGEV
jgi:hypothetical protein